MMTLMSLFDRFKSEAEFREQFIKPLLNRLGFYGVAEQHGAPEVGKDFVFSELHRLGGLRHYAAVVKHLDKINQGGDALSDVLRQVGECWTVPFTRPDSPHECHVSSVYVFNSGKITPNARTIIAGALRKEKYGENVHFLDGERLALMAESLALHADRNLRQRLLGFMNQMQLNQKILFSYQETETGKPLEARGMLLAGIEDYLNEPIESSAIRWEDVILFWQDAKILQGCAESLASVFNTPSKAANLLTLKQVASEMINVAQRIIVGIDKSLESIKPLL
jgi:hypothetical protein